MSVFEIAKKNIFYIFSGVSLEIGGANLDSNFQIPLFYEISLQENEKHNQRQVLITGNMINNNFILGRGLI